MVSEWFFITVFRSSVDMFLHTCVLPLHDCDYVSVSSFHCEYALFQHFFIMISLSLADDTMEFPFESSV